MGYYIANHGVQQGPFDLGELPARGLRADSLVWTEGMPDWQRADAVAEVARLLPAPHPMTVPRPTIPLGSNDAIAASMPSAVPLGVPGGMLDYHSVVHRQGNGMAVASMVLGIVSVPTLALYCMGVVLAILSIIFGFVARARVQRGETQVGAGMALAGLILGFVSLGLCAIGVVFIAVMIARAPWS
jgi:hypothetical protein